MGGSRVGEGPAGFGPEEVFVWVWGWTWNEGEGLGQRRCRLRVLEENRNPKHRMQMGKQQDWTERRCRRLNSALAAIPGDQFSCPVHSWSTGEEVAGDILRHRLAPGMPSPAHPCVLGKKGGRRRRPDPLKSPTGSTLVMLRGWPMSQGLHRCYFLALSLISVSSHAVTRGLADGWRGWTVAVKNGVQWAELSGHDYVLDLVSDLELLKDFPRQKSYFIVGAEGPMASKGGPRA